MSKPTNKGLWATNSITDPGSGRPNKVQPPTVKENNGWIYLEKPPFNWLNWWMDNTRKWHDFIEEIAEVEFSFTGVKSFIGTFGAGNAPLTGAGVRMFFYPKKAAFRAGSVSGTQWNDGNIGDYSSAFGKDCTASGEGSHAQGDTTSAVGVDSHTEGEKTWTTGAQSHCEGLSSNAPSAGTPGVSASKAEGIASHCEGLDCYASGNYSHAEGRKCIASGIQSHSEGFECTASGINSHVEGIQGSASGGGSHAEGEGNIVTHSNSHIMGKFGDSSEANSWFVGNGASAGTRGLGAKWLNSDGEMYIDGTTYNTGGADYAEMFEWKDGNKNNDDRIGLFVTLDGGKIKIANKNDFIAGIVSGQGSILGNNPMNWKDRYLKDVWGRFIFEEIEIEDRITKKKIKIKQRKQNPKWTPDTEKKKYIDRVNRKEWDAIGLLGQIFVKDNGKCEVDKYCDCGSGGIAVPSETGYRVLERINKNIIKVLFK